MSSTRPPNASNAPTTAKPPPPPEAILYVLEACPGELIELRATLVQKHVCGSAKASRSLERGASRTLRTGIQNHRRNRSRRGKQ